LNKCAVYYYQNEIALGNKNKIGRFSYNVTLFMLTIIERNPHVDSRTCRDKERK